MHYDHRDADVVQDESESDAAAPKVHTFISPAATLNSQVDVTCDI